MNWLWQSLVALPTLLAISLVRVYQICISPFLGRNCRYVPSCSQYYILAVQKYGLISGSVRGLFRILRCHPWSPVGEDYP